MSWPTKPLAELLQIPVDDVFDTAIDIHRRRVVERQRLHHDDDADFAARIDEEVRVEDPGPRAAARCASVRLPLRGELKAESPSIRPGTGREVPGERLI